MKTKLEYSLLIGMAKSDMTWQEQWIHYIYAETLGEALDKASVAVLDLVGKDVVHTWYINHILSEN